VTGILVDIDELYVATVHLQCGPDAGVQDLLDLFLHCDLLLKA
jgi:hypothetical protein